ncbi:MAG TPA: hypothetical protein VIY51_15660, partial [Xanthobacteraceae bacterium]
RVRHECAIAMREAAPRARYHGRGLPRAAQLSPISGIPPVDAQPAPRERETSPLQAEPAPRWREPLPFHLAPPLASERLQPRPAKRRRNSRLRGALCILIASALAGSIVYRVSGGGVFSASDPAHAAFFAAGGNE